MASKEYEELTTSEYDVPYFFNGSFWDRTWMCRTAEELDNEIRAIRRTQGDFIPIMVIRHPANYPLLSTSLNEKGLQKLVEDWKKIRETIGV